MLKGLSYKKILSFIGLVLIFLCILFLVNATKQKNTISISLTIKKNGIPLSNTEVRAFNVEEVFDKIETGNFSNSEIKMKSWHQYHNRFDKSSKQGILRLSNGVVIGKGIRVSKKDTAEAIRYLWQKGKYKLLFDLCTPKVVSLKNASSPTSKGSNKYGKLKGDIDKGFTVFTPGTSLTYIGDKTINSRKSKLTIDTSTLSPKDFSIKLINGTSSQVNNAGVSIVTAGQLLKFKVSINRSLLSKQRLLILQNFSNIQVQNFSISYTKKNTNSVGKTTYKFAIPKNKNNFSFEITCYVTSAIHSYTGFTGEIKANGIYYTATGNQLGTSGINLIELNSHGNPFNAGSFILGKVENGQTSIFSYKNNWEKLKNLTELKTLANERVNKKVRVIVSGNSYFIAQQKGVLDQSFHTTSISNNIKEHQSIIQLTGLGQGKYFLYPIKSNKNKNINKKQYFFSVFSNLAITPNGTAIAKNSVGYARNQNFSLNSYLPNYIPGSYEYTVLTLQKTVPNTYNNVIQIIVILGVFVLLVIIIGILIIKRVN